MFDVETLLAQLGNLTFATGVDAQRNHSYRLNTLEDHFPGPVLDQPFLQALAISARERYDVPLHYELVLLAQTQLKQRKYRFAILEAETAFEVYVADLLVAVLTGMGRERSQVLEDLENPGSLGLLSRRLKALDTAASEWRQRHCGMPWVPFMNDQLHADWKSRLYTVRNRVVHAGAHEVTFDDAKRGIEVAKAAIRFFEGASLRRKAPVVNDGGIVDAPGTPR